MEKDTSTTFRASSEKDLLTVASELIKRFPDIRIWLLRGNLGAGKTALVRAFASVLHTETNVSSPTFGLVNEYQSPKFGSFFHFDLYRCEDIRELYRIGIEEYLDSGAYCFFEWPDLAENLLEEPFVKINISVLPDFSRTITVTKYG